MQRGNWLPRMIPLNRNRTNSRGPDRSWETLGDSDRTGILPVFSRHRLVARATASGSGRFRALYRQRSRVGFPGCFFQGLYPGVGRNSLKSRLDNRLVTLPGRPPDRVRPFGTPIAHKAVD